ncbi:ubiquitin protein ligase [Aureococcus anophagefferens]|nr:ubiquitin protein ligase [Aureococcus anophagefferens]
MPTVRRDRLLADCYAKLRKLTDAQWRWPFFFTIAGEKGLTLAAGRGLPPRDDDATVGQADRGPQWLTFAGKLVGKALLDGAHLDAHLNRCLLKHVCGEPLSLADLEWLDAPLWNSLRQLGAMDVSDLALTFSVDGGALGKVATRELVRGGADVAVTEANKDDSTSTSGGGTTYKGAFAKAGEAHDVVRWFWEAVAAYAPERRAKLLQWCTGHGRVPVQGFSHLMGRDGVLRPFTLTSIALDQACFPRAHTCFNRIDIPLFAARDELRRAFDLVLDLGDQSFSMD